MFDSSPRYRRRAIGGVRGGGLSFTFVAVEPVREGGDDCLGPRHLMTRESKGAVKKCNSGCVGRKKKILFAFHLKEGMPKVS